MLTAVEVERPRLSGVRILVAEDDLDLREGIADLLESESAQVTTAGTGEAAFEAFQRDHPDIVLSDIWMPNGTGYDLIARIRQLPAEAGRLTPAIAVSAAENQRAALLAGFHAFLSKPFDAAALVDVVADFAANGNAQAVAPWTISVVAPGTLTITLVGRVGRGDMRAMMKALRVHLENGPVDIVVDLRGLGSFAPSVASIAERAVWDRRDRIRHVELVGGSWLARLIGLGACKVLGLRCTLRDGTTRTPSWRGPGGSSEIEP